MKRQLKYGMMGGMLGVLLLGCALPSKSIPSLMAQRSSAPVKPESAIATPQPQRLPTGARMKIGKKATILLEVARTQEQQSMGLMYRTDLADNRGMLFEFDPPRDVNFWMKNTLIPLDMIFLRQGKIAYIALDVPPCAGDPCPIYGPQNKIDVDAVIELRGRRSRELGLKVGDRVQIQYIQPKGGKSR